MEIQGKLIYLLALQSGEGKNGIWKKQEIVIETLDNQYPKKICISIWGDKINHAILKVGNILNISFDVESREYNNKWYTDVKAWKVELNDGNISNTQSNNDLQPEIKDDLPF